MPEPRPQKVELSQAPELAGTQVGRFIIERRLGSGGMGEVYRARDTRLDRTVALKRIAPEFRNDRQYTERFFSEARRASAITDPHVASLFDVLEEDGEVFLVMEYVEGQTLRQRLADLPDRRLPLAEFMQLAMQCADALQAAHTAGVVHCDIKPENIMLTGAPGTGSGTNWGRVKVLDFGVARRLEDGVSGTTVSFAASERGGTPAYMAPEALLQRSTDARADLFSLGVVFYEALSGQQPFQEPTFVGTCDRVLHRNPEALATKNPEVPPALASIVARLIAKDSSQRYATAAELTAALQALFNEAKSNRARRWVWTVAVAATLAVLAAVLAYFGNSARGGGYDVPRERQVAVLPFKNVGAAPEQKALSEGLAYVLSRRLAEMEELRSSTVVLPPAEVAAQGADTPDKARKILGANLVVSGSFQRSADDVVITAALVDTRSLRQLRSATVQGSAADLGLLEDRVALRVAGFFGAPSPAETEHPGQGGAPPGGSGQARELYILARGYLQNYDKPENVDKAIAALQSAIQIYPNEAAAHAALGEAYWYRYGNDPAAGWAQQALAVCRHAVKLGGAAAEALTCLGTVYSGTGRYDEAVPQFQRALAISSTQDAAYRGLAETYEKLGRLEDAEATYRRAIELRPRYWGVYNWMGVFYANRARYDDAARMFGEMIRVAPDTFRGYSNLGAIYVLQGRYNDALAVLNRSVRIRPNAPAYGNLARAYFSMRLYEQAVESYQHTAELQPREYVHWGNLGAANYYSGRRAQAAAAHRRALELAAERLQVNPRDAVVLSRMANYHAMLGERKQALELLEQGLAAGPVSADLLVRAAEVHVQIGDAPEALQYLRKALQAGFSPATVRDLPAFDRLRKNSEFQALLKQPPLP